MSQLQGIGFFSDPERQILKFIREADGWVFREQIEMYLGCDGRTIDTTIDKCIQKCWIKGDIDAEGIVTIPSMRDEIDTNTMPMPSTPQRKPSIELTGSGSRFIIRQNGTDIGNCTLDNTGAIKVELNESHKNQSIKDFHLFDICTELNRICRTSYEKMYFTSIKATDVVFEGTTSLIICELPLSASRPWFTGFVDFSKSHFCGEVIIQNIDYRSQSHMSNDFIHEGLRFRECEFHKSLKVQRLQIQDPSGYVQFSLEDAKIEGSLMFYNTSLDKSCVNCLQMALGSRIYCSDCFDPETQMARNKDRHQIIIKRLTALDGFRLDFSEVEMSNGDVILNEISSLGDSRLRFAPMCPPNFNTNNIVSECPDICLEIKNSTLRGTLELGNIKKLHFQGFQNLGIIRSTTPDSYWGGKSSGDRIVCAVTNYLQEKKQEIIKKHENNNPVIQNPSVPGKKRLFCPSFNRRRKTLKPKEVDKIVANHIFECAQNLSIIKKNYEALGLNDAEDEALVAYMNHNYCPGGKRSGRRRFIFSCLDLFGKYGTAPKRILLWLLTVWGFFSLFLCAAISLHMWDFSLLFIPISLGISLSNMLPFSSMCYTLLGIPGCYTNRWAILLLSGIESMAAYLLIGYLAIAIVRKTMR